MTNEPNIPTGQLETSEATDEDELGVDPLERGIDLAQQDGYLEADRYGMTAHEQATSRSWDSRLAEEEQEKPGTATTAKPSTYVPVEERSQNYSHGGEAGYDSGYSDGNTGSIVSEPDEPAADETVTPRNW
ncbi:MAG: hypothetical protein ACRDTD_15280 [Pseudonocardiaceae bacterium]